METVKGLEGELQHWYSGARDRKRRAVCGAVVAGRGLGSAAEPGGFLPWGCFSAISGSLEKTCLM